MFLIGAPELMQFKFVNGFMRLCRIASLIPDVWMPACPRLTIIAGADKVQLITATCFEVLLYTYGGGQANKVHEFSLAQSIIDIAVSHARQNGAGSIRKVGIALGVVSHVAPASLKFSFDLAKEDTPAHKAELVIRRVALEASCKNCAETFFLQTSELVCPRCGSSLIRLLGDQELMVEYIEVDD